MTPSEIRSLLRPGDCLLYAPNSVYGWLIAIKTYTKVSHCEVYVGNGRSAASRDGVGVGIYPLRTANLAYVLRYSESDLLDWVAFWKWFRTVNGQKYDWLGLLRFVWWRGIGTGKNARMFCSEFQARAYRELNARVFSPLADADAIVPADFLRSPSLVVIATPQSLRG